MTVFPPRESAAVDVGGPPLPPVFVVVLEGDAAAAGAFLGDALLCEDGFALLSTLRLTDTLCGTTGAAGLKTSSGEGAAGCVGERGTDVLLPTVLIGGGVAPGILIGGGAACFGWDWSAATAAAADVGLLKADLRSSKFLLEKVRVTGLETRVTL